MFYNYIYLDPRKPGKYEYESMCFLYEPLYVGKGKSDRCFYHLKNLSRISNPILRDKLNYLKKYFDMRDFVVQFNFTMDENESYENETNLIREIGSKHIDDINDGPLVNICLDNRPPSFRGKTYQEIYGDKYEEQIEKRRRIQLERGGYFGGKKHTQESKDKISIGITGDKNPMFGKNHSAETIEKIRKMARERFNNGFTSPTSKKWIVISPDGEKIEIFGKVKEFCSENNLSYSSLHKTLKTGKKVAHGRTKGWILKYFDSDFGDFSF